jgi:hypothetical protein
MHPAYSRREIFERSWNDSGFLFFINREKKEKFLQEKESMKGQYLGACLDYVRVGAMNACFWNVNDGGVKGLVSFIDEWINLNKDNLIWHEEELPDDIKLPRIDREGCLVDGHKSRIKDLAGRVRCGHISKKAIKPSFSSEYRFFDSDGTKRADYSEDKPFEPDEKYGEKKLEKFDREIEKFNREGAVEVIDPCYSIISESEKMVMPLEKILRRLRVGITTGRSYCKDYECSFGEEVNEGVISICIGHDGEENFVGFPFDGWFLAYFVQRWHEQSGNGSAPLYMNENDKDSFRLWPDFKIFSSDD